MFVPETTAQTASTRQVWAALLAAVVLLGLLLAFLQVVREAVRQGELRGRAHALLLEGTWRCNTLRDGGAREACLRRLEPVPRADAHTGTR